MNEATADRSIELVVQCTNKLYIVWTSDSESLIADRAELGTIIGSAFDDEKVPSIEAGSPSGGALLKTASRLAGAFLGPQVDTEERTASHICMTRKGERFIVWPPKGAPIPCGDLEGVAGTVERICADESQPRVRAGGPVEPVFELGQHIADGVANMVTASEGAAE